jgi:tripartite-type tricarboxylate transporter receptor subunit TctC
MTRRRPHATPALLLLTLLITTLPAVAEVYPAKPVRMIVPYQAGGGGLDTMARLLAQKLSEQTSQRFYVENVPGAGGTIGAVAAARAVPDGHTVLFVNQDFIIQPLVKQKAPYDPFKDFEAVSMAAVGTEAITINPTLNARNVQELFGLLKASPGKYSFATPGHGTSPHLASERLFHLSHGLDVVHVPFQGGAPAVAATIAGHTHILHINLAVVAPHLRDGKLRALAVADGKRAAAFPDIPTLAEAGVPAHEVGYWNGIVVPAGTARPIVDRLGRLLIGVLAAPEVRERLAAGGFETIGTTPEAFAGHMARESAQWSKVVRDARIHAN